MNLSFYIAKRYLFSKKSHNAINIISMVSVGGVLVATAALVCVLSVFNGFDKLVADMFSHFDPELKITPATGKVFDPNQPSMQNVRNMPEVLFSSEVLQENALVKYKDRQDVVVIKGVDEYFEKLTRIDSVLIDGRFVLREDVVDYATVGIGLATTLGVNAGFVTPLEIFAPKRDEPVNMANPSSSFNTRYAYIGGVFCINQQGYDDTFIIVPLELARELFRYEKEVTAIELKLQPGSHPATVKKEIKKLLGDSFKVQDRYEQQEDSFKMMQMEKWMTFLILAFILAIALFNIVGSLSMLMIEKQEDVRTLQNMGADGRLIKKIFLFEGWMISALGAITGIVLGLIICLLQQEFGLLRLGDVSGAFIIDAYPVRIDLLDILTIFVTVAIIGFLAAWYPVHYLGKKWFPKR